MQTDSMSVSPPAKKIRRRRTLIGTPGGSPRTSGGSVEGPISQLPDELTQVIFGFLPSARDRCACAAVSKRWLVLLAQMRGCEFNSFRRALKSQTSPTKLRLYATADDAAYDKVKHPTVADVVKEKDDGAGSLDEEPEASRCLEDKEANDARLAAMAVGTYARRLLGNLSVRGGYAASAVSHHRPSMQPPPLPPPPQRLTDFGLEIVSQSFPNLRSLSLWDCLKVGSRGLASIARCCRALERLDISNSPEIGDEGLIPIARGCPSLSALTLQSCPRVGDRTLEALAHCSSNLRSVSISDCLAVGDTGVVSLVSLLPELTMLRLSRLQLGDAALEAVGQHVQGSLIRSLVLEDLTGLTAKGFAWVRYGDANGCRPNARISSKLEFLNLRTAAEPESTSGPIVQPFFGALRHLSIKKCVLLDDETLLGLALSSRRLEELRLQRCPSITARGVLAAMKSCSRTLKVLALIKCDAVVSDGTPERLLDDHDHTRCRSSAIDQDIGGKDGCFLPATSTSFCPLLDSLTLKNCTGVDDHILMTIAPAVSTVTRIVLEGLPSVSDRGVLSLLQCVTPSSVSPVCISLAGCSGVSDWSVLALAKAYRVRLQALNLEGCRRVGNGALRAVVELCPALRDLDVGATRVGDAGIAALAAAESGGLRLEVLSLSGCSGVTDKGLTWLELMCGARLVGVNLQHCAGVSRRAIDSFRSAFWWCDILC